MGNKNEILSLTLKLLLISAIIAVMLAAVNMVTKPIIAGNNQKTFEKAMGEVLPDAKGFEKIEIESFAAEISGVVVNSLYKGSDGGFVVEVVCSEGYGGDIRVMVGITDELKVKKAKIMAMSETPGLGAKTGEDGFINQFNNMQKGIEVVKNSPKENQIQAVSGATISSKAVTKAVNTALDAAEFGKGGK